MNIKTLNRLLPDSKGGELRTRLLRGASLSVGLKILQMALAMCLTILLARMLGPDGFGAYSYALTLVLVAAMPMREGLSTLLTREIAAADQRRDWGLARGLLRRARQAVVLYSVVVFSVSIGVVTLTSGWLDEEQVMLFLASLILFPVISVLRINSGILRGHRAVIAAQIPDQILRQGLLIPLIALLYLTSNDALTPYETMVSHLATSFVALTLGYFWYLRRRPPEILVATPRFQTRFWFASLLPLTFIGGMQLINTYLDILMLGPLTSSESVGIYRVAMQGAMVVAFALTAINMVIGPYIVRLYVADDHQRLQRMVTISSQAMFWLAVPVAGLLILFGTDILGWVFGESYRQGGVALALLCAAQLLNAAMGSVGLLLNMTGHERDAAIGLAAAAALNIVLNTVLIPMYGIEGAAVATALSTVAWNVLLAQRVYARTGIVSCAFLPRLNR